MIGFDVETSEGETVIMSGRKLILSWELEPWVFLHLRVQYIQLDDVAQASGDIKAT